MLLLMLLMLLWVAAGAGGGGGGGGGGPRTQSKLRRSQLRRAARSPRCVLGASSGTRISRCSTALSPIAALTHSLTHLSFANEKKKENTKHENSSCE